MIKSPLSREELLALPLNVPIELAGRALGIGRTKSYELARAGEFPLELLPVGHGKYRVPRTLIFRALRFEEAPGAAAGQDAA